MIIIYGIFIGLTAGFLWGAALGITVKVSLLIGAIAGFIVGFFLSFFGKIARMGGNLRQGETVFVNSSILTIFGIFAIGTGALAWIIRLIFF